MTAPPLPDGDHDAMVVDASSEGEGRERVVHLVLALTDGDHRGEVVELAARGLPADELTLLGLPAVVHVVDGQPRVSFDRSG